MVEQQLYSQQNTRRKAAHLFQRSLLVSLAVLSVSCIEWRLCGLLALSIGHYAERQHLTGGSGRRYETASQLRYIPSGNVSLIASTRRRHG